MVTKALPVPPSDIAVASRRKHLKILTAMRRHPASSRMPNDLRLAAEIVGAEIDRARRYERALSLLCLPVTTPDHVDLLRRVVRETDQTALGRHGLIVVLPETDALGTRVCVERLAAVAGVPVSSVAAVSFPDDALTAGHLWQLLDERTSATRTERSRRTAAHPAA